MTQSDGGLLVKGMPAAGFTSPIQAGQSFYTFLADMPEAVGLSVAHGVAALMSRSAPEKSTPNEDAAAVVSLSEGLGVLIVADGLGGHVSGETAAQLAVEHVELALREADDESDEPLDATQLRTAILNGFESANQAVLELGTGAATTLCVAELQPDRIRTYHVGDSGIYLIGQRGKMKLQTIAHSPIGYALESGLLDEADAIHHEHRHVISNVLGSVEMRIEIGPTLPMAARDTLLLATDGLLDNLLIDEIVQRVRKGPLVDAVQRLADDAWRRMQGQLTDASPSKPDDLTIVAFRRC